MPTNNPAVVQSITNWPQAAVVIIGGLQTVLLTYLAVLGNSTHDKATQVQQEQTQVKKTLQRNAEQQYHARGVQLWTNYQYLKELSERMDATPQDKAKAAEAKKLYDEYVKHPRPQPDPMDND
jgi:hypothetical protein